LTQRSAPASTSRRIPPSSPAVALFRDGKLVFLLERHQIQGQTPESIATALSEAIATAGTPAS
jgi:putative YphP/YqiW family bacilliredoxin